MSKRLSIIRVPNRDDAVLAWIQSDNLSMYYKYPLHTVGFSTYEILEAKPEGLDDDDYFKHYAYDYALPKMEHRIVSNFSGWLSPSGDFFPCRFDDLTVMAMVCHVIMYVDIGSDQQLWDRNWAQIRYTGRLLMDKPPTSLQILTLKNLILDAPRTKFSFTLWQASRGFFNE